MALRELLMKFCACVSSESSSFSKVRENRFFSLSKDILKSYQL